MYGYFVVEKKAFNALYCWWPKKEPNCGIFLSTHSAAAQSTEVDWRFLRCTEMCVGIECFRTAATI